MVIAIDLAAVISGREEVYLNSDYHPSISNEWTNQVHKSAHHLGIWIRIWDSHNCVS